MENHDISRHQGIRPLTYAAGNDFDEVCLTLIAGSADVRAEVGAKEARMMESLGKSLIHGKIMGFHMGKWEIHLYLS